MNRAAIYARYSSDLQSAASIEDQVRDCTARIEAEGWQFANVYTDHGISGASTLRPGYQKLLQDGRNSAFNIIVAEGLDRLSRDQEDVAALYKHLSFAGVRLITLAEGEISELHVGLKGTMNALYLKDLAQKTRRGLEGRVRQGRSGGGLCYGYDVVKETDGNGAPVAGGRNINCAEADVVRRIFTMFAGGQSPRAIARTLNTDSVPGPRGRPWSDTTIRGHATRRTGILHNDLYAGQLIWNKQRYVKDPRTGKRLARPNPPEAWVIRGVPELRIVDETLWAKVQDRLSGIRKSGPVAKARETKFWEERRPRHLLTGLVDCGVCGGAYASIGRDYLGCSRARRQGNCSNSKGLKRSKLEGLVLDSMKSQLMAPEHVEAFLAGLHQEINRHNASRDQHVAMKEKELEQVKRRLSGLIEAIADGLRSDGLQQSLTDLETRKAALEAELPAAPPPAPRLHPNLAQRYRERVEQLHKQLSHPAIRQEAVELLRGLIERIVITPHEEGHEIELVGDIVKLLELPCGEGSVRDPFARSAKVVAGAGFGFCDLP